jgi:phage gp36-like protein
MTYCSISDIQNDIPAVELAALTDDTDGDTVNEAIVNSAIVYADTIIDGYLRSRYSLPLEEVPTLLKTFSVDLVKHRLYSRRMTEMPDSVKDSYKNTIKMLESIQAGKLTLGIIADSTDDQLTKTNKFITNKTTSDKVFSVDVLNGF